MFQIVSLTSQGQISIPSKMRKKLGWDGVDKLSVREVDGKVVVEKPGNILSLSGVFAEAGKINKGKSLQQIIRDEHKAVDEARMERWIRKEKRSKSK